MAHPVRRNIAHLTAAERQAYVDAVLQADLHTFADGVSYWDKQDQIHQSTHNHGDNSFIPWHRELVNRYEALLRQSNPDVALHYWDWTEDPRAASDGQGGTVDLTDPSLFGSFAGMLNGVLASLHNGGTLAGSREDTGDPADPPQSVQRSAAAGNPGIASDQTIITASDGTAQAQQWTAFRLALESAHNSVHGYIGGDIGAQHQAFEDPFVFLLHANVDRLFAMWQTVPGQEWRLDPSQVYGDQATTTGEGGIQQTLQPWDGTVVFGAPIEPWVGASPQIEVKDCRHPSVVRPPCYDTLPLTVEQVAPVPPAALSFVNVVELLPTARALRLRVRGCATVTATATVTAPFTLLSASVTSPEPDGFGEQDLLVWVLYTPGAAGSSDTGTLTVTVNPTGDVFTVPITATVVANPSVGTSLVLDTSGSMSLPSGLPNKDRMAVLHDAAPLFVALLDPTDGVGVVRFDTDAAPVTPVVDAGPTIGGAGRLAALNAISTTATNLAGLTAIGDGLEAAAAQLTPVAAGYDSTATIVFTDGNETAEHTIAQAAASVNSRVFAIGLGTADQLNPGALSDIANGTGGYLLLTGNPGVDDQLLLQKYFAQVLAGATNAAIVVDPAGFVPVGGKAVVPFDLTDADIRADVLLLGTDVTGAAGRDHRPRRHQHHRRRRGRGDRRRRVPGPAGRPRRRPRPTGRRGRALAGGADRRRRRAEELADQAPQAAEPDRTRRPALQADPDRDRHPRRPVHRQRPSPQRPADDRRDQPAVPASRPPRAAGGHPHRQRCAPGRPGRRARSGHLPDRHRDNRHPVRDRPRRVPRRDPHIGLRRLPDPGHRHRRRPSRHPLHPRGAPHPRRLGPRRRQPTGHHRPRPRRRPVGPGCLRTAALPAPRRRHPCSC